MSLDIDPNHNEILTGSFSAADDMRGEPLSSFHIRHEEETGTSAGKIGAVIAIALVLGGAGAYGFFNAGQQPAPKNVVADSSLPKPPAPAPVAPAPAPTDTAMNAAPAAPEPAAEATTPKIVKSEPVKSASMSSSSRMAAATPVQQRPDAVAPPAQPMTPADQSAAVPATVAEAPVPPAPPPSSLAVNGQNATPETTPAAQSAQPEAVQSAPAQQPAPADQPAPAPAQ